MKNSIISIFKKIVPLLFLFFLQNSAILGQQVIDANITGSSAANNICIDCLEPTNIDDAGEVFQNKAVLYALDENEEGYALWKLNNFTSNESVNLNLLVIEGNSTSTVGYSVGIYNNTISIERWGGDFVEVLVENISLDDNEIKIERKDGVINYYIDNDLIHTISSADQRALFANFTVINSEGNSVLDPNIYFTFPNQISDTPPTGTQCSVPSNVALDGIPSSVGLQSGSIENLNDGIIDYTSEIQTNWVANAWAEIELDEVYEIDNINIWNTTSGNSGFLQDFVVFVSEVAFESEDIDATFNQPGVVSFPFPGLAQSPSNIEINASGKFIRIQLQGTAFINMREMEIFCKPSANPTPSVDTRTYTKLKKELDGSYVQLECSEINFQYVEDYAITAGENAMIECKLYNWQREAIFTTSLVNEYGVNWQNLVVSSGANDPVPNLASNTYYTLEVTGANKGEKYKLRVKTGDVLCPNPPAN